MLHNQFLNAVMAVEAKMQDVHVSFRANDRLVAALSDRARQAGCSVSEYLRSIVRQDVGL